MIIDSHTHLGDFPLFNVSLNSDGMIRIMKECEVTRCLVSSLPNTLTLEAIKKYPRELLGMIWINPHEGERATAQIDEAITQWGFKGIKMHPLIDAYLPDQELVYPIMDQARKHRIPVLFHCGHPPWSLPWHFANLAEVYPDVTIILGHMGHGHIVYINAAIAIAKKHENLILETSAMPMHSKIKEAVDEVDEERVIYGSDMPFGHPDPEIRKVQVAGLTREQLRLVLEQNTRRIFRL